VQFSASLDEKKIASQKFSKSASESSINHTPKVNPNSLRILNECGFDFKKPFFKRFSDNERHKEEKLELKRHEIDILFKNARKPSISDKSREMIGDRGINI